MDDSQSVSAQREVLLKLARNGDKKALADLLDSFRNYMKRLGRVREDKGLRKKIDTSDVVQESQLQALKDFSQFRGEKVVEFINWYREILRARRLKAVRRYSTQKRNMKLEHAVNTGLRQSTQALVSLADDKTLRPLDQVIQRELEVLVSDMLDQLPDSQRVVVELHHMQQMTQREVAKEIGITENAVQKLWARALANLSKLLKEEA